MALRRVNTPLFSSSFLKYLASALPCSSHEVNKIVAHKGLQFQLSPFCKTRGMDTCSLHTSTLLCAGHSKWQNIMHIKAKNDKIKADNSNILVKKLQGCLNRNASLDPKLNTELDSLMKWAKSKNIPNDVFNKQLEKAKKLKDPNNITTFDGRGLDNVGIIIEAFTLNKKHTQAILQGTVKKAGITLFNSGSDLFEHKGLVDVEIPEEDLKSAQSDPDNFDIEKYVDIAIEVNAEDVTLEMGEEKPHLTFVCGPFDIAKVQTGLEDMRFVVKSAERTYVPTERIGVTPEYFEAIGKLEEKLDLYPEVVKYYFNVYPVEENRS